MLYKSCCASFPPLIYVSMLYGSVPGAPATGTLLLISQASSLGQGWGGVWWRRTGSSACPQGAQTRGGGCKVRVERAVRRRKRHSAGHGTSPVHTDTLAQTASARGSKALHFQETDPDAVLGLSPPTGISFCPSWPFPSPCCPPRGWWQSSSPGMWRLAPAATRTRRAPPGLSSARTTRARHRCAWIETGASTESIKIINGVFLAYLMRRHSLPTALPVLASLSFFLSKAV